jgi:hypothetical protein
MMEVQSMIWMAASVFGGLIVLAMLFKTLQECIARRWPSTPGRVLTSEQRWKEAEGTDRTGVAAVGNYPMVLYEYEVSGRKYRAHRLALGLEARNSEVAEVLARYPVGAAVTVYYNPARPDAAILERQSLRGFAQGLGGILAIIACAAFVAPIAIHHLILFGERVLPGAQNTHGVIVCGTLGLLSVLFGLFSLIQTLKERRWPVASGRIISSRVDISRETIQLSGSFKGTSRTTRSLTTIYRPVVVYRYEADGLPHESSRITAGVAVRASTPQPARNVVERYPVGSAVTVRYNPNNAAESILETSFGGLFTGLILGAVLLFVALAISGFMHRPI